MTISQKLPELLPPAAADRATDVRLNKIPEEESSSITNRPSGSTYPEKKSVLTSEATPLDAAASGLYDQGSYVFRKSLRHRRSREQMIRRYEEWVRRYPVWSIEDGMAEEDVEGWSALYSRLGSQVQLAGDDLFATNVAHIREAANQNLANAVLIKLNQIGTITETMDAVNEARRHRYDVIVSHRSGETTDDFIADLAVAISAGQIKTGAPVRGERVAKYNQLLRIEQSLGTSATYAGAGFAKTGGFRDFEAGFDPQGQGSANA